MKTETVVSFYKKAELVCLIAFGLLLLYLLWVTFSSPFSRANFDAEHWAEVVGKDDACTRGSMVNDLLKNRIQTGMQKEFLLAILGKPDRDDGREVSYYLGFCQTFVDPDTLDFYFDAEGKLTKHEIINH
jgi:outer membrane protein assembly factor BamE (lipoprotein component of BamABCDE complex)